MKLIRTIVLATAALHLTACTSIAESAKDSWEDIFGTEEEAAIMALDPIDQLFDARVAWKIQVGEGIGEHFSRLAPAVAYDKVFAASREGVIKAVDKSSGKVIWEKSYETWSDDGMLAGVKKLWQDGISAKISGGLTAAYNKLFVGTEDGYLYALNVDNGEQVWRANIGGEILAAPVTDENMVLVTTSSGKLFALDADTGEQNWQYESDVPALSLRGASSAATSGGGAITGTAGGKVAVILMENGQVAWEQMVATPTGATELDRMVDIDAQPKVVGGFLYVISYNGTLAALELRSGRVIWKREYGSYRQLAVEGNSIFVVDTKSHIYALDRRTGVELWSHTALDYRNVTAPVPLGSYVVVSDKYGYVHWLRQQDGKVVARKELDDSGFFSPSVVEDRNVILQSRDGQLFSIETP